MSLLLEDQNDEQDEEFRPNYEKRRQIVYDVSDNTQTFTTDGAAENVAIELEADSFIDFTESNPFGDPSDTY